MDLDGPFKNIPLAACLTLTAILVLTSC